MHRLIVAFLSAFDAAIVVAVGIAATLAPLTLVWVFALGDAANWEILWPASAVVWQLGHLVPLAITLPGDYLAATGIDESAASFVLSLAPLAFASFTMMFAARSGARASRADAWLTGVGTSTLVVAVLSALVALTSSNPVASVSPWQAVLYPTLLFAVPALTGAVVTEWREAGYGFVARFRDRVEAGERGWGVVPGVTVRASAAAVAGIIGVGALSLGVAFIVRAGDIVALYQAANLDLLGAIVVTLAQLAYLPTLVVWGVSFVAGPGFSVGEGTAVSPSGTQSGVLPGIPALGLIPESSSSWLLLVVLLPVAVGVVAGWIARSRMLVAAGVAPRLRPSRRTKTKATDAVAPAAPEPPASSDAADPEEEARRALLEELLARPRASATYGDAIALGPPSFTSAAASFEVTETPAPAAGEATAGEATAASETAAATPDVDEAPLAWALHAPEPFLPRLVVTLAIAVLSGGAAALLAVFASGSFGPGRLAAVGPEPGPVALAVGLEVLVGAAILLLSSRGGERGPVDEAVTPAEAVTRTEAAPTAEAVTPTAQTAAPGIDAPAPATAAAAASSVTAADAASVPPMAAAPPKAPRPEKATPPPPGSPPQPPAPHEATPAPRTEHPVDPDADTAPIDLP